MAGAGFRTWSPGEVITANNVQTYLMDQSVLVFASTADRSAQLISPTEGMLSWLEDANKYQYFEGSTWQDLIPPTSGGTAGQALVSNGTAAATFKDVSSRFITTSVAEKTSNYTITADDINNIIVTSGTANITLTVPDVLEVGDVVSIVRDGAGSAIITAGTGVTGWAGLGTASTSQDFFIDLQYRAAGILKTAAGTYRVIGAVDTI
jgi:hypothetical protein